MGQHRRCHGKLAKMAIAALALCVIGGSAAEMTILTSSAGATPPPTMAQNETLESTPGGSTLGEWPIKAGTIVTMTCWTEGPNVDGSKKWFHVKSQAYPYPDGYVPANSVKYQAVVGLC
jgi:hypothetical protein